MASKEQHVVHCDTKTEAINHARDSQIVTRRGYVITMEKGKEGIHKKFDEILSTTSD